MNLPGLVLAPPGTLPFSALDALAVTRCAEAARDRLDRQERSLLQEHSPAADQVLLSRLPLYQRRIEHPFKQGAIYCRSGGWLELLAGKRNSSRAYGAVRGTKRDNSRFAILEFISIAFGLVSIRGLETQEFMCMDQKGALYATPAGGFSAECVFMEEMLENYYNLYSSCAYGSRRQPWYLSLRRSGRPRRGGHSRRRHRSSHFIVVHFDETGLLDPVPLHLNRAAARLQSSWMDNYGAGGGSWRRRSMAGRRAPASLLHSHSRALSDLLASSLRLPWTQPRPRATPDPAVRAQRPALRDRHQRQRGPLREDRRRHRRHLELDRPRPPDP